MELKNLKMKSSVIFAIFFISIMMLPSLITPAQAYPSYPQMRLTVVYVKFNSGGGTLSHQSLRSAYGNFIYDARDYWSEGSRDIPVNVWLDDSPAYDYVTFPNIYEFQEFYDNEEPHTRGNIYVLDTEHHEDHIWWIKTIWSSGRGNVPDGDFSMYVYARHYDAYTHKVNYISMVWLKNIVKQGLGWSLTMGDCWYGTWPNVQCIMTRDRLEPQVDNDLCWLCYRALDRIKNDFGW